ncbi:Flp family type IVb pilin [Sinimarinibacterium sp. CAU 1509]|uniref:Flp family type IVb pilin n=1 Tax=Sinimarinibacterium sp. CAU 1509 TaxID=2562283 RepID=UPI0010AC1E7B|nr:Flp family type IVb pilin [Sinimarinibacterium sp. CAU 1509]TJY56715.1 Flp family type IVb pilin [Sinimarinibacterium sp. CAU 1509]
MVKVFNKFLRDEEGASAVEYGLIVGLIAVALIVVLTALGGTSTSGLKGLFTQVKDSVDTVQTPTP